MGIVAVDPTSPFHGGAILGDRIRMQAQMTAMPESTFAVWRRAGRLADSPAATADICTVIEASGKSRMLIETVGVGQDEVEVARLADVTVVVLMPGMGDDVQSIKAGVMEIADIFVINKSDREGAERVESEILAMQSYAAEHGAWVPPIVRTVATTGEGVAAMHAAIARYVAHRRLTGGLGVRCARWRVVAGTMHLRPSGHCGEEHCRSEEVLRDAGTAASRMKRRWSMSR